jgi:hypothetical protein
MWRDEIQLCMKRLKQILNNSIKVVYILNFTVLNMSHSKVTCSELTAVWFSDVFLKRVCNFGLLVSLQVF